MLVAVVLAAGAAMVMSVLATEKYRATSGVLISAGIRSIESEAGVAAGSEVEAEVRAVVGDEPELSVEIVEGADVLRLSAVSTNAENAAFAANTFADVVVAPRGEGAEVIDRATVPADPFEPRTWRNVLLAAGAGLLIGLVAAWIVRRADSTIRSRRQLADVTGVPNLAVIPRVPLGEPRPDGLATARDPNSVESEAYRTLRTAYEFVTADLGATVVMVTSPRPGEGKSSVASNLAAAAALAGRRVVLVDGDLRKPRVHRMFGLANVCGLSSVLTGEATLGGAVQRVESEGNLAVLSAGPPPPDPAELLTSERLGLALGALAQAADLVVVDVPPVLPVTDATILAQHVDVVLLAATADVSDRREWAEMMERLDVVGATVIGTVLSRADARVESSASYRYAPSAPPPGWWVSEAGGGEAGGVVGNGEADGGHRDHGGDAPSAQRKDTTEALPRSELLTWAETAPDATHEPVGAGGAEGRNGSGDEHGDHGRPDIGLDGAGSGDRDSGSTADETGDGPSEPPPVRNFGPPSVDELAARHEEQRPEGEQGADDR